MSANNVFPELYYKHILIWKVKVKSGTTMWYFKFITLILSKAGFIIAFKPFKHNIGPLTTWQVEL